MRERYARWMEELKEGYEVEDVVPEGARVLFLLESPHKDEVRHRTPVAGWGRNTAGRELTKALLGEGYEQAFGILVKQEELEEPYRGRIAIMNVCPVRMQRMAYPDVDVRERYAELFDVMEKIRSAESERFKEESKNIVRELIVEDIRGRLERLRGREILILPCGAFARICLKKADVTWDGMDVIGEEIPHPARGFWTDERYRVRIEHLKQKLQQTVQTEKI